MLRTISRIATLLVVTFIALVAVFSVALRIKHAQFLSVQTGSMVPNLNKGDLVVVTRVPDTEIGIGDVITYTNPANKQETITHRVVGTPTELGPGNYQTKGDANPSPDPWIPESAIVGKATTTVRHMGYFTDFLRKPWGLLLFVYIPALLIIGAEVRKLARHYREEQVYKEPGYSPDHHELRHYRHVHLMHVFAPLALVAVFGTLLAPSARAALGSTATLTGTTIATQTVTPPAADPAKHVVISRLALQCHAGNQEGANGHPRVILYNQTTHSVDITGWQLRSKAGVLITLPSAVIGSDGVYSISPTLTNGLRYDGDHLSLYDAASHKIDGLSWGTDVTELNPSPQNAVANESIRRGTSFSRLNPYTDYDTAADWHTTTTACSL